MNGDDSIVSRYTRSKSGEARLDPEAVGRLAGVSLGRTLAAVALEYALIVMAAVSVAILPVVYPFAILWIGARFLALWVIAHDGVHGLLARDRTINERIARWLLAPPIFLDFSEFRRLHLQHHRALGTDADPERPLQAYPEFRFPKSGIGLAIVFALDLLGINWARFTARKKVAAVGACLREPSAATFARVVPSPARATAYVAVAVIVTLGGWWTEAFAFWLVPYATAFQALLRARLMAEHMHIGSEEYFATRTIEPAEWERWWLIPHNVNFHIEHHLYPGVPYVGLPRLHAALIEDSEFRDKVPARRGYLRTFGEFLGPGAA